MNFSFKKNGSGTSGFPGRRKHRRELWRRIVTAAVCVALLGTNIGETSFAAAAMAGIPVNVGKATPSDAANENRRNFQADESGGLKATISDADEDQEEPLEIPLENDLLENDLSEDDILDGEILPDGTTAGEATPSDAEDELATSSDAELELDFDLATRSDAEAVYTLYLTHYFRFAVDGQGRNVRAEQTLELTEEDFEDGVCDLSQFVYNVPQLTVTEAKPVSEAMFDENHEGGARIVYSVNTGWRIVRAGTAGGEAGDENAAGEDGIVLREVFNGQLTDYEFIPADVVRMNVEYKYSKTGGLMGIDAADPEIVEALPVKNVGGDYDLEFMLPIVEGFRVVLNPDPLNQYLMVKPSGNETQEELLEALERGDFSVDIDNHEIYYYQQVPGGQMHPDYKNIYSTEYNHAWNEARTLTVEGDSGYILTAISGEAHDKNVGNHGANALVNPKLRVTLNEKQLSNALENGLNITINYRRNATWYTVNHWVPEDLSGLSPDEISGKEKRNENGINYVLMSTEDIQGRAGSLTRAAARTDGIFEMLVPLGFSQKIIENTVSIAEAAPNTNLTTVDIFYEAAASYRVIFNTNYTYIPRQVIPLGKEVNFKDMAVPTRKGYEFAGWQYLKKDAEQDASGEYPADAYEPVPEDGSGTYKLEISPELISEKAKLQNYGGVPALYLYPIWNVGKTQITVTLWTEDLTGTDDVQAIAEGGNAGTDKDPYLEKYKDYQNCPVTHDPVEGNSSLNYSNAGSFVLDVDTDLSLVQYEDPANPSGSARLLDTIQEAVADNFKKAVGGTDETPIEKYYTQADFKIMHSSDDSYVNTTTADADGKTVVYVYFTRNIYTLKFHYYGETSGNGEFTIAKNTNGFSFGGAEKIIDPNTGDLNFDHTAYYTIGADTDDPKGDSNHYNRAVDVTEHGQMPTPEIITIRAKYGADLRDVWPSALVGQKVTIKDGDKTSADVCSWATTSGKYRRDAITYGSSHYKEPTIMGLYATMDEQIIADEAIKDGLREELKVHHLVAYWSIYGDRNSHYRYNHCYEVPGLDIGSDGVKTIYLLDEEGKKLTEELNDTLYLVPVNNEAFTKFGFNDFMEVSFDEDSGKIAYGQKGGYYAVRGYRTDGAGEIRYYALARQVEAVSTNAIKQQNPSARAHMVRANLNADHSTEYKDTDGSGSWEGNSAICGQKDPYDLYFYYDRIRYTISYMAPTTISGGLSEIELGHIELPFGAHVTEKLYAFNLYCRDNNHTQKEDGTGYKYLWTYPEGNEDVLIPVCPDRAEDGATDWKFKGWGLGPMGVNMQWEMADVEKADSPQAHVEGDFYIDSNLRLYAIWETPTYTVTFHLNGGVVNSKGTVVQRVAANTIFNASGAIPRPVRYGYTLSGWYLADENGNLQPGNKAFGFDEPVIRNMDVAAVWTKAATKTYDYHVYYMTEKLRDVDNGKYPETLWVSDNDIIDPVNGREYYVLKKEEHKDQAYAPGTGLNIRVTDCPGYIPIEKNKILVLDAEDSYNVFFRYVPQTAGSHVVKFVVAGTETGSSPTVVKAVQVEADQTVATPGASAVAELLQKGYELVSIGDDGAYHTVTEYAGLTWIDGNGNRRPMEALAGGKVPDVIIYLVRPIDYTIKYENAGGSPEAAGNALSAVTAAEGTPVGSTSGKNPTRYNTTDVFVLKNPAPVIVNGIEYRFSHWSLGNGTQVVEMANDGTYSTLRVDPGTMGDLVFVANWTAGPKQPTPPGSGGSSGSSGSSDPPSTPTVAPSPAGPQNPTVTPSPAGPQDPPGTVPTGSPKPPIDDSPQTGDETNLALWWALMCISGIGMMTMLAMLWLLRRKKEAGER